MSDLSAYYAQLRTHAQTVVNELDTYQRCCIAETWGVTEAKRGSLDEVKARAIKSVETRLLQLCEYAGVRSRHTIGMQDQIYALLETNQRLTQTNKALTDALHRAAGRPGEQAA